MADHLKLVSVNESVVRAPGPKAPLREVDVTAQPAEKQDATSKSATAVSAQAPAAPFTPVFSSRADLLTTVAVLGAASLISTAKADEPATTADQKAGTADENDGAASSGSVAQTVAGETASDTVSSNGATVTAAGNGTSAASPSNTGATSAETIAASTQTKATASDVSTTQAAERGSGSSFFSTSASLDGSEQPLIAGSDGSAGFATDALPFEILFGTAAADVLISSGGPTTFVIEANGADAGIDVIIGSASNDTLDLSRLKAVPAAGAPSVVRDGDEAEAQGSGGAPGLNIISSGNGVLVDLTADDQTGESAIGTETVQLWQLNENGEATRALAHLESIDTVIGTTGSDIVAGDGNANTFIYTADSDAEHGARADPVAGENASYGFDIYAGGGETVLSLPDDATETGDTDVYDDDGDTVDFSRIAPALDGHGHGDGAPDPTSFLPFGATGITIDLEDAVTIEITNPRSGESLEVTGAIVSTHGGTQDVDLALVAFSSGGEGRDGQSTIENIVGSGGADVVLGDAQDNSYFVAAVSALGAAFFDGRSGSDTIDFSRIEGCDDDNGVAVYLGQGSDSGDGSQGGVAFALVSGEHGTSIALLANVENVVGSRGGDIIAGDESDNVLTGGQGSDTFLFLPIYLDDGRYGPIGHDVIRDFQMGYGSSGTGSGGEHDQLVFDATMFGMDSSLSQTDLLRFLFSSFAHESENGVRIDLDSDSSVELENLHLSDFVSQEDGQLRVNLSAIDAFIFI